MHSAPKHRALALVLLMTTLPETAAAQSVVSSNLTGLPLYPNLSRAAMDEVARTDTLGRWCNRFSASSADSLATVQAWYRKALAGASETDLANDDAYRRFPGLVGIKLARGIDYVTVYRTLNQPTAIELYRCSPID